MKCTDCKYYIEEDYGYSNYTVEGNTSDCLLGLNPGLPKDSFYGEEPSLWFAEKCSSFSAGDGVFVDCERYSGELENYSDDPEVKELLRLRG